jgi:hypothetical protein
MDQHQHGEKPCPRAIKLLQVTVQSPYFNIFKEFIMKQYISAIVAAAASLALQSPAQAACDQTGHIHSVSLGNTGSATLYMRTQGPASTLVYSFSITDDQLLDAAIAAVPGRTRVKVTATGLAVCSTGAGAPPIVTSIFVTP